MDRALELLTRRPAQVARLCGLTRLNDEVHGRWLRQMISGREDMTLLAHRGSFKTSCLAMSMAVTLCVRPRWNLLFLRKTDDDVLEVMRLVRTILRSDAMRYLTARLYGAPVTLRRSDQFSLTADCYAALRGAPQLVGQGVGSSLTGKHADLILTDDIVNLSDRISAPERQHTRQVYQELQNIRNPGGRIVNTGTPWHPEDAIALMPNAQRWDWRRTGLLSPEQAAALRSSMSPSLFAANYELRHMAEEGALFPEPPRFFDGDEALLGGVMHIDAAYGGGDFTAVTCGARRGDEMSLYGRLFPGHVDQAIPDLAALLDRFGCRAVLCETNGDKGYLGRELRALGFPVRMYHESAQKYIKIATHLRRWWPRIAFLRGTDPAYLLQIHDYAPDAPHDDAPDSAACLVRYLERGGVT